MWTPLGDCVVCCHFDVWQSYRTRSAYVLFKPYTRSSYRSADPILVQLCGVLVTGSKGTDEGIQRHRSYWATSHKWARSQTRTEREPRRKRTPRLVIVAISWLKLSMVISNDKPGERSMGDTLSAALCGMGEGMSSSQWRSSPSKQRRR